MGQPAIPQVLQLSTVSDAQLYFRLAQEIKMEAGEIVGITRQRQGKINGFRDSILCKSRY